MKANFRFLSTLAASFTSLSAFATGSHAAPLGNSAVADFLPTAALPYVADSASEYGCYKCLGGAQLFVPAREGLTTQWLMASAQQALAGSQRASAACDVPNVDEVSVSVVSSGAGFWVQLIGKDHQGSKALLHWANALVSQRTSVCA